VQRHDGAHGRLNIVQRDDDGAVTHGARQRLTMLGANHDLNVQTSGGVNEIACPVRGGGQQ
jgi:aromatic ring hydroxylase